MKTYWCSFVSKDEVFLGVVLANADSVMEAMREINRAGINPGGQVASFELPEPDDDEGRAVYALPRMTLLSKADLQASIRIERVGDMPPDEKAAVKSHASIVCDECNTLSGFPELGEK